MPLTREKYVIGNSVVNGVTAIDSLFAAEPGEPELCNDEIYMTQLYDYVNQQVSQNQLENASNILLQILRRRYETNPFPSSRNAQDQKTKKTQAVPAS